MHIAFHPTIQLAFRDFRALGKIREFHCDEISHEIDRDKPLPPIAPRTGQSPQRLLKAILALDLYALGRELTQAGGVPVNDPIPGWRGRTVLHVLARLHGLRAGGWSAIDRAAADVLNQMTALLLSAGADPCARDRDYELPSAYTEGRTPPALLRRMEREAADGHFDVEAGRGNPVYRMSAPQSNSRNGLRGRARAHAEATGEISNAVGHRARIAIMRKRKETAS